MRIPIASMKVYDWQGPQSGVKFRVVANQSFLARDNDDSGFQVDANPKVFREVDCTFAVEVIDGLNVNVLTVPAMWLFSTTDAIVNRLARYSAYYYTTGGGKVRNADQLQNFQLPKAIADVFNPVPWKEIIRYNNPASPIPFDISTFSREQILEIIGGGSINKGVNTATKRVAFWSGPVTIDGAADWEFQDADPQVVLRSRNTTWNTSRIVQSAANPNTKTNNKPALQSLQTTNHTNFWNAQMVNDAASFRWGFSVRDGATGLHLEAYDSAPALAQGFRFDPAGGIGLYDEQDAGVGYFFKGATGFYHFGINAGGGDAIGATKEVTLTTSGVGVNKSSSIGAQFHIVSGASGRVGFIVDTASSPSQPIAILRNNANQRFLFNHDGVAEFGLASSVKGRLTLATATGVNKTSLEAADTPASSVVYKMPAVDPANGQVLRTNSFSGGVAVLEWVNPVSGGDVSSSIGTVLDNKLARFDGTSGKLIQDSAVTVLDTTGAFTVPNTWTLNDANGNEVIRIGSVGSAVSEFTFTNAASGGDVILAASSDGANAGIVYSPKGTGLNQFTKNILFNVGPNALDNVIFINSQSAGAVNASFGFMVAGSGSGTATDGPYFFARGNNWSGFSSNQKGSILMVAGNIAVPTAQQGQIRFFTGNEVERFTIAADGSPSVFTTNVNITKGTAPQLRLAQTSGTAKNFIVVINGSGELVLGEDGVTNAITVAHTSGVTTFSAIPVGPASNPTTANQLARKQYVDDSTVAFSVTIVTDEDPNTAPGFTEQGRFSWFVPDGNAMTITKLKIKFQNGSHTSGGSLDYQIRVRDASGGVITDLGPTATLNNTNNVASAVYTVSVGPFTLTAGHSVTVYRNTLSGTVSERSVSVGFIGTQKRI